MSPNPKKPALQHPPPTLANETSEGVTNGKTTTVHADNPKDTVFELVAQVPGQVKKASKPRKRKAPRRPSNTVQRTLPDLPTSGGESKA